jgi:hypothetical protein
MSQIKRLQKKVDLLSCVKEQEQPKEPEKSVAPVEEDESQDEEEFPSLQAPKLDKRAKGMHERTEAQKAATERLLAGKALYLEKKKLEKQLKAEQEKKELEEKILSKAISIKKKQLKKSVLDEISDDDTPMEEIKAIVKTKKSKPIPIPKPPPAPPQQIIQTPLKPKYVFV